MPLRRIDLTEQQRFAEDRYAKYTRTARDLLQKSEWHSHRGNWSDAANELHAALESVAAAAGVCRELHLIYLLRED